MKKGFFPEKFGNVYIAYETFDKIYVQNYQ